MYNQGRKRPQYRANIERTIPSQLYPEIDTDLARDNLENDITAADLQDM